MTIPNTLGLIILEKSNMFTVFEASCHSLQREKGETIWKVVQIQSDQETTLRTPSSSLFNNSEGISHEFFASIMPQHYGIVERKNRMLQEKWPES